MPRSADRYRLDTIAAVGRTAPGVERKRNPVVTALRVSLWSIVWLTTAVGVALTLYFHRGDAEGSARIANREIEFELDPGETIEQRVPVRERHWWNYFRVTHGILAATDRRLLYVGVPPAEILPREPEPQEIEQDVFPYGPVAVRGERVFLGTLPGVQFRDPTHERTFGIAPRDGARLAAVIGVLERRQFAIHEAQEQERLSRLAELEAERQPRWHVVARGEALASIAVQYGTTVDLLRAWNGLTGDKIKVGQRLLVKPRT